MVYYTIMHVHATFITQLFSRANSSQVHLLAIYANLHKNRISLVIYRQNLSSYK